VAANFGVLDWPAGLFVFSTAFNSCRATVYVQCRALQRAFPLRALQKFCLFSSAVLTMDDHCSLSPVSAVRRRREIVLLVAGTPTLTCYMCPSKMPDIPALGCQSSLARLSFQVYTHSCLSLNDINLLLIHTYPVKLTQHPTSDSKSYVTTDSQSASLSWCQAPIWG
jgi:hypothetical protein